MTQYNPPFYSANEPPIAIAAHPDQSMSDIGADTPVSGTPAAREYYAPDSWCETYLDDSAGERLYRLKSGYLTPDGLMRYRAGQHSTAPAPEQLDPVDLTQFRVISPHMGADGGIRPLWYDVLEKQGGASTYVPSKWLSSDTFRDNDNGQSARYLKDGYLTPGLLDLIVRNRPAQPIAPPDPTRNGLRYTLPNVEHVTWEVNGEPTDPGTYTVTLSDQPVTVTIEPIAAEGYVFDPAAEPTVYVFDPEETGEPGESEAVELMRRLIGAEVTDDELAAAYLMVRRFVHEYTRGRGFSAAGVPNPGIMAVIVSGAARLAVNPEQAVMYSLDGITVRPGVFNGYTLAEQGVLHRYRRRFA